MRTVLSLAVMFSLGAAAPAADPKKPDNEIPEYASAPPVVVLAKAQSTDGKVTLKVTIRECVFFDEQYTVAEERIRKVDGKDVKEVVTVQKTRKVCKAVQKEVDVPLAVEGVTVTDLEGKAVSPADVLKRLEKKSPILRSWGGPPDPYYLQTTKSDTLILVTPLPPQPPQPVVPPPPGTGPMPAPKEKGAMTTPPAKPKGEFEPNATEQEIIDLTNAERKKANLPALTASPQLVKAARLHSENMAKQGRLDHTFDDKTADQRVTDAGYKWARTGENIAKGQRTPEEAITSWMNSQGHRDNILTQEYVEIGVAVSEAKDGQKYWTMVLARPR